MIVYEGVTYRYPRQATPAIRELDWHVEPGSFVLLTGPSGAGKSTIIRCPNGLIPHFHGGRFGGRVLVAGRDTRRTRPADLSRVVGFVAQNPETQTVLDRVEDEIAFGPENMGLSREEMQARIEELLTLLGISTLRDREIATLSGGERQRVVIAAAMAMRPEVLVLDEPTSQLDPEGAAAVLDLLCRLNETNGTTVVLAEHHLERTLHLVERALVLDASGQVLAEGRPRDIASALPYPPPLLEIADQLGWTPPPLTVEEARQFRRSDADWLGEPRRSRTAPGPSTVVCERLTFSYDDQPVLRDASIAFGSGSVTVVMGRNGSGKTTLLKHLNGLLRPSSGRVLIGGRDIRQRATRDLAGTVGYLPQNPSAMLFNDTVVDELLFTLRCLGRQDDPTQTLEMLGLQDKSSLNPLDLSSGERQRVALAAVLVGQPEILLMDEPTRGLDPRWKRELARLVKQLAARGMTVVMATHDVELAAECADRVVAMDAGRIVTDGPPESVLARPSPYATQINQVFGGGFLTPDDVLSNRAEQRPTASLHWEPRLRP